MGTEPGTAQQARGYHHFSGPGKPCTYGQRPWEESEEFSKLEKRNNGKCCCWLSIFIQKLFVNTAPAPTAFLPLGITEEL